MNSLVVLCFAACMAYCSASLVGLGLGATLVGPSAPGVALQGPAASGLAIGPDGSHTGGAGQAGALIAPPIPGGVVSGAVAPGAIGVGLGTLGGIGLVGHGGLLG